MTDITTKTLEHNYKYQSYDRFISEFTENGITKHSGSIVNLSPRQMSNCSAVVNIGVNSIGSRSCIKLFVTLSQH